jgi:hypothetical protein
MDGDSLRDQRRDNDNRRRWTLADGSGLSPQAGALKGLLEHVLPLPDKEQVPGSSPGSPTSKTPRSDQAPGLPSGRHTPAEPGVGQMLHSGW